MIIEDGIVIDVNPSLELMLGCLLDNITGMNIRELGQFLQAGEIDQIQEELRRSSCVSKEAMIVKRKDGGLLAVEFVATSYELPGK